MCALSRVNVRLVCGSRRQAHQPFGSFDADDEDTIWAFVNSSTVYLLCRWRLIWRIVDADDGIFDLDSFA
jgi:hypothetical protein